MITREIFVVAIVIGFFLLFDVINKNKTHSHEHRHFTAATVGEKEKTNKIVLEECKRRS